MSRNKICNMDLEWISSIEINDTEIRSQVAKARFINKTVIGENTTHSWLIKAINCVDLSLLFGNETPETISKLCKQAAFPLEDIKEVDASLKTEIADVTKVHCAAVCVYPLRIEDACQSLATLGVDQTIRVAAVAAGFPTGQFPLHTRLGEIYYAVVSGAQEIDVVIDRSLVLRGLWPQLYDELVQMRKACGKATLKVILSVTECGSWTNLYKAAAVAMLAGTDFVKTSTGKEATTMTLHEGFVMCQAVKDFYCRTGVKVGIKPAGGVRTAEHVVSWMLMVEEVLGVQWLNPTLLRIGTSGTSAMIGNIANAINEC